MIGTDLDRADAVGPIEGIPAVVVADFGRSPTGSGGANFGTVPTGCCAYFLTVPSAGSRHERRAAPSEIRAGTHPD